MTNTKSRSTNKDNSSKQNASKSKTKLNSLKTEVASSLNISLNDSGNGELTSKEAGSIGGQMVKRMIEYAEKNIQ